MTIAPNVDYAEALTRQSSPLQQPTNNVEPRQQQFTETAPASLASAVTGLRADMARALGTTAQAAANLLQERDAHDIVALAFTKTRQRQQSGNQNSSEIW